MCLIRTEPVGPFYINSLYIAQKNDWMGAGELLSLLI